MNCSITGVCTTTPLAAATQQSRAAIAELKKPSVQQRIGNYFKNLLGLAPDNFQENLLLLAGTAKLNSAQVHVLLATVKTVINEPELQGKDDGSTQLQRKKLCGRCTVK